MRENSVRIAGLPAVFQTGNFGYFWRGYLDRTWTKCSSVFSRSQIKMNVNCIVRFSSYRALNTSSRL